MVTMVKALSSRAAPADLSAETRLNLLAFAAIFGGALLFVLTRRVEVAALIGLPLALRMLTSFRTSALVTTCVMLVWFSRIPTTFFDLVAFSYVVYASVAITAAAFFVRFTHQGGRRLPLIANPWLCLYVIVVLLAGANGLRHVDGIPAWIVSGDTDYGVPWVYFRTIVLPGILLPLLTVITAVAIADRQKLATATIPLWIFAASMATLVLANVFGTGVSLSTMGDSSYRDEHLSNLGFHSNEFGSLLAIAYGLLLGVRTGIDDRRWRGVTLLALFAIGAAQLSTFSRGAMLAFVIVNGVFFITGSVRKRALFIAAVLVVWLMAPAAIFERAQFGWDSMDLNEISAGRLENIWLPVLPDVADNLIVGQGLNAIMWTDAQRFRQIYPVKLSHNAYLDLLLDLGIVGAFFVLAWYVYLWRAFKRGASTDPDRYFRAFFRGAGLALLALLVCALSNDRLTPTAPAVLLWIAAGVVLGRQVQLRREASARRPALPKRGLTCVA